MAFNASPEAMGCSRVEKIALIQVYFGPQSRAIRAAHLHGIAPSHGRRKRLLNEDVGDGQVGAVVVGRLCVKRSTHPWPS
jgi:hypothetical protein